MNLMDLTECIQVERPKKIEINLYGIDESRISNVSIDFNDGRASETHYTYNDNGTIASSTLRVSGDGDDQIPGQMSLFDFIDNGE